MGKYTRLVEFLALHPEPGLRLSFEQVESVMGAPLPSSARKYAAFWSAGNHAGRELGAAGWRASPRFGRGYIEFHRVDSDGIPQGAALTGPMERPVTGGAKAHRASAVSPDIVLVGCVKQKHEGAHRADELYTSALFAGRMGYARSTGKPWFVLSSLYGLLRPDDVIETYDVTLKALPVLEREAWSRRVLAQVDEIVGPVKGKIIEIHAGAAYRNYGLVEGLRLRGAQVEVPLAQLRQGEQLAWYRGSLPASPRAAQTSASLPRARPRALPLPALSCEQTAAIARQLTEEFMSGGFDLSARENAPSCGWTGIPEIRMAEVLRAGGASDRDLRIILTLGVALDRARDADRLWDSVAALYRSAPWAFDPQTLRTVEIDRLREVLAGARVSQRHIPDSLAWRRIGSAMTDPRAPKAFRDVVLEGGGAYGELIEALRAVDAHGQPWFPLLRGPKISLVWVRMMAEPGGAEIRDLDQIPVAVDVQVRKATEYLGVTETSALELAVARPIIEAAWREAAADARGPKLLAATGAALDPAIWFFGKWGCSYCERAGRQMPISSVCEGCRLCTAGGAHGQGL